MPELSSLPRFVCSTRERLPHFHRSLSSSTQLVCVPRYCYSSSLYTLPFNDTLLREIRVEVFISRTYFLLFFQLFDKYCLANRSIESPSMLFARYGTMTVIGISIMYRKKAEMFRNNGTEGKSWQRASFTSSICYLGWKWKIQEANHFLSIANGSDSVPFLTLTVPPSVPSQMDVKKKDGNKGGTEKV